MEDATKCEQRLSRDAPKLRVAVPFPLGKSRA